MDNTKRFYDLRAPLTLLKMKRIEIESKERINKGVRKTATDHQRQNDLLTLHRTVNNLKSHRRNNDLAHSNISHSTFSSRSINFISSV